ncbi:DUF4245 domain-containing protein [Sinomonas mesophila]|uniref:DUF4245 domain-containing protein n=1 Tax=Sinomonas mesophila TaxID=1531955 RepID=UPI001FE8EC11|nr:DUF4245 domain-containing protein [Sinomonas mesophila]
MSSTDHSPQAPRASQTPQASQASQQDVPVKPVISAAAAKRANASVIGMIMALAVSVLAFVPIVLLNVAPTTDGYRPAVDVAAVARNAAPVAGFEPVAPALPEGYSPNYARWNAAGADGVAHWDVGWMTPEKQFVSLVQTATANPTWLLTQVKQAPVTGTRAVGGVEWTLYDKPGIERSLVGQVDGTTVVLSGSAGFAELDVLAEAVVTSAAG